MNRFGTGLLGGWVGFMSGMAIYALISNFFGETWSVDYPGASILMIYSPIYIPVIIGFLAGLSKKVGAAIGAAIISAILYVVLGIVALIIGGIAGFFGARYFFQKQMQKNPPISEKMIRALFMEMGRKPSEAQIKRIMKSFNSAYK